MRLGVHVSVNEAIYEAVEEAKILHCETMQFFPRNPRKWRKHRLKEEDIKEFKIRREELGISPVFVHVPYPSNLASPINLLYRGSIRSYIDDIQDVNDLGVEYLVTHMGSHKKTGEAKGLKRVTKALNLILDKTKNTNVMILLENTSGSGSWLGYKFKHQSEIINGLTDKSRVGICFDTCHAFCAGYDFTTEAGLEATLKEIDDLVGLNRLKVIHLNDSKDRCGSRRDRHEDIGKGYIGKEAFKRLINHPKLRELPMILETPKESYEDDLRNLEVVRSLYEL
jgi:deoxyribonuclease-4